MSLESKAWLGDNNKKHYESTTEKSWNKLLSFFTLHFLIMLHIKLNKTVHTQLVTTWEKTKFFATSKCILFHIFHHARRTSTTFLPLPLKRISHTLAHIHTHTIFLFLKITSLRAGVSTAHKPYLLTFSWLTFSPWSKEKERERERGKNRRRSLYGKNIYILYGSLPHSLAGGYWRK